MPRATTDRPTYHHGDLRNALITAGAELAETGGPEAVGVRAAARAVGVTPTAAYRHFANADDLLREVKERALTTLGAAMQEELRQVDESGSPGDVALRRLAALGRAYVRVALAGPGLFRMAFGPGGSMVREGEQPPPFDLLVRTMDELVASGYLPAERRPMAEFAAWSTVHGLACLVIDGQLGDLPEAAVEQALQRVVELVEYGFAAHATRAEGRHARNDQEHR